MGPIDFNGTPVPSYVPSPSHTPDYLTPTLLLLLLNITLPTLDLYKDITMLIRLSSYPQYWAWGIFLFAGVFLNFMFTCLAWWRLEPRQKKSWTWILLLLQVKQSRDRMIPPDSCPLQVWPQARAVRVLVFTWRKHPTAKQEKAKLDREVGGLEPFLESMPTVFVIAGMSFYKERCQNILCTLFKRTLNIETFGKLIDELLLKTFSDLPLANF